MSKLNTIPFIAYSLLDFFSLTKYTFPTSPLPINLILSKLPGPTSTSRTFIEFELYVLLKATALRIWPGDGTPSCGATGRRCCEEGAGSTMLRVEEFACCTKGSLPSSAVCGLSFDLLLAKRPCALGADATRRSFRASSSFPAVVA